MRADHDEFCPVPELEAERPLHPEDAEWNCVCGLIARVVERERRHQAAGGNV